MPTSVMISGALLIFGAIVIIYAALWLKPGQTQHISIKSLGVDFDVSYSIAFVLVGTSAMAVGSYFIYLQHEDEARAERTRLEAKSKVEYKALEEELRKAHERLSACQQSTKQRLSLLQLPSGSTPAMAGISTDDIKVFVRHKDDTQAQEYAKKFVASGPMGTVVEIMDLDQEDEFQVAASGGWRSQWSKVSTGYLVLQLQRNP